MIDKAVIIAGDWIEVTQDGHTKRIRVGTLSRQIVLQMAKPMMTDEELAFARAVTGAGLKVEGYIVRHREEEV